MTSIDQKGLSGIKVDQSYTMELGQASREMEQRSQLRKSWRRSPASNNLAGKMPFIPYLT